MFDILIIGGGHAGLEAAHIASQFQNLKIGMITLPGVGIASAPCNPSVGGVGKGQVVRELDALGGIMPKLADLAGIQFRTLNESKGYAVQSTRVQIDKVNYSIEAEKLVESISNLSVIREKVVGIENQDDGSFTVSTESSTWNSQKLIITVGTFLNGKMHTGSKTSIGGRSGCEAADSVSDFFKDIKTNSLRFKTGTPARLDKNSVNYEVLEEQPSDSKVNSFHVLHGTNYRKLDQVSCYLAYTTPETMKTIRDNKEKSPMFNGQINAVGARYCPSIEDKAYRYPDKDKHHVFVEPESHELDTVYPSGISTSLPEEVQLEMIRSIKGFEKAEIKQFGYAVEYDVIETTELDKTLQMKSRPGLYFAGQVNGTSGYEEAAGQGYVAGVNAVLAILKRDPLILDRNESYIGVMIEDLVSNTRDEPYRLFTARSENRLYIREDNSILRMNKYRAHLELALDIDQYQEEYCRSFMFYMEHLESLYISPDNDFVSSNNINLAKRSSLSELIKQSDLDPIETLTKYFEYCGLNVDPRLIDCLAITIKYSGYIDRANEQNLRINKLNKIKINWENLCSSENISFECKRRIEKIKPETFGQLRLIEGIRPATLAAVAGQVNAR